jgi:hypothetical protein
MPTTYTLISSSVLSSPAAVVSLTSIPATYTDLVLRASMRTANSATSIGLTIQYNTYAPSFGSNTNYSRTRILGNGSTVTSATMIDREAYFAGEINAATSTANTFSSFEMYIPNYADSSQMQTARGFLCQENNGNTAFINATATLYNLTTAVSSIFVFPNTTTDFVVGSSFRLYGILKS